MSRALALTAGVLCGFLAAGLAFAGPTAHKPRQAPAVAPKPGEPIFVVNGRGWGHGVGMSQWGANGFARKGWTYDRILTHYYRGTAIADAPVSKIRVLLTPGKRTLTISSEAPFRVRDGAGKVRNLAAGKLVLGPGLKVKPKAGKRKIALQPPLTFMAGTEPLWFGRRYRGTIKVDRQGAKLRAINVVGLEPYLYGVVPSEVPDDWPAEVLKAQAVAARSYALATRKTDGDFDVYPDVRSQVYRGVDEEVDTTTTAVDATAGEVLNYQGAIATTYFFSTSGGKTASVVDVWPGSKPTPYLVSVDDPYDSLSPHHLWGPLVYTVSRVQKVIKAPGRLTDLRTTVNTSARVKTVTGVGTLGQVALRGSDVRRELGLRSTWFRVGVLALPIPAKPLAYGAAGQLTGTARGLAKVVLEQQTGTIWKAVGTVQPAADGAFTITVRPTATTQYRLAAGTARTAPTRVEVSPQVALSPITDAMELRGSVKPLLAGAGVRIQRLNGRTWATVGRATVDGRGDFSARIYVPPGSYRALVPTPGRGMAAGKSSTLVVNG